MDEEPKKKRGPPAQPLPGGQFLPMMGLGTYKITDRKEMLDVLRAALLAGYRHIDTAVYYQNESALGWAVETCINEGRCKREDLFIATKTFNHVDKHPVAELKAALARLNLKYVDLYYVHVPVSGLDGEGNWTHRRICDLWKDMEECVRKGYTRHLGISNFNGQSLLDLLSYCKIKPIVNQIEFHPYLQQSGLVDICQKNGVAVVAFMPLGRPGLHEQANILKDEVIVELGSGCIYSAQKYGKSQAQIVLKFLLWRGIGVIPKTKTLERLKENYDSWNFQLTEEDVKKLKALHRGLRLCDFKVFFGSDNIDIFD